MSEWKEYKLSDLMQIKYGKDHKHLADGPYPLYGSGGVMRYVEKPLYELESILIPRKGTLSNLFYLNEPFWSVDTMFYSKINYELTIPKYLYYTLKTFDLASLNVGSAVPSLTTEVLNEVLVSVPDLPTQTAIAEILSSLDDKIELNNKINLELENLAQTLFKQWFIDFEFPDENGEPYKSSGGEMVDSELGEIPKDWEVLKIGEVLDFVSGYPFKGASFSKDGNYGIVTIKNVQDGLFVEQIDNYIDELPNKFPVSTMLTIGDILMSLTGNVGRVCYVTSDNCLLNQRVVKFKSVQENANSFWYYYFRQNAIKEVLISISKGTAQLNLSPVETKLLQCKLPTIIAPHILSAFDAIFSKQIECSMENKNLSNLRDTLLPKLISGELEINQTLN